MDGDYMATYERKEGNICNFSFSSFFIDYRNEAKGKFSNFIYLIR